MEIREFEDGAWEILGDEAELQAMIETIAEAIEDGEAEGSFLKETGVAPFRFVCLEGAG